jgi:hypothetical protein
MAAFPITAPSPRDRRSFAFLKTGDDCNMAEIKLMTRCTLSVMSARRRNGNRAGCNFGPRWGNVSHVHEAGGAERLRRTSQSGRRK